MPDMSFRLRISKPDEHNSPIKVRSIVNLDGLLRNEAMTGRQGLG